MILSKRFFLSKVLVTKYHNGKCPMRSHCFLIGVEKQVELPAASRISVMFDKNTPLIYTIL